MVCDSSGVVVQEMISFCVYNEECRNVKASITINAEIIDLVLMEMLFVH
jgi:hypothetical protein